MFTTPIQFLDAQISALSHKFKDGVLNSRIQCSTTLTPEVALKLGCEELIFLANGAPKEGFDKLELSTGCQAFRARFEAPVEMKQQFEINGDSADTFTVERQAEGIMRLKMRLNYHGDPHEVLSYVLQIGAGTSRLTITPLQAELEAVDQVQEATVTVTSLSGKTQSVSISKDMLRAAVGAKNPLKQKAARR